MNKNHLTMLLATIFLTLVFWLSLKFTKIEHLQKASDVSSKREMLIPQNDQAEFQNPTNSQASTASGSANIEQTQHELLSKMEDNIEMLHKRWTNDDLPLEDEPQAGMANADDVLKKAKSQIENSGTLDVAASRIFLVNGTYIVCVPGYADPFYFCSANTWNYDRWLGFDAWTGKFIGARLTTGGKMHSFGLTRQTGGDGSEESIEAYQDRMAETLRKLVRNIRYGKVTESEPKPGMIAPETAIQTASKQVEDRNYDRNKNPWPILIDDVYLVTFWKKEEDIPPEGGRLYDSRVGVDANTGEFIAMDVAPPFRSRKSGKK